MTDEYNTIIVNLCGGPGIGKSRTAARLFADLKDMDQLCEIVTERAKDLAWKFGGNPGAYTIQPMLHAEQLERQSYSLGKVKFLITDSPSFLPALYQDTMGYGTPSLKEYVMSEFKRQNNININLIRKPDSFVKEGRHLSEEEAAVIDNKCTALMNEYGISYLNMSRDQLPGLAQMLVDMAAIQ